MKKRDVWSSILWLAFGLMLCVESYRLGMGTLHNPGPGLYPLGIGLVTVLFSLIIMASSFLTERGEALPEEGEGKANRKDIVLVIITLFLYALILEHVGFVLSTLLFIVFILKIIERKKWVVAVTFGLIATAGTYVVFNLWLDSNLPRGILGF
jgi:putative tricarboxylic transport membrane protein